MKIPQGLIAVSIYSVAWYSSFSLYDLFGSIPPENLFQIGNVYDTNLSYEGNIKPYFNYLICLQGEGFNKF